MSRNSPGEPTHGSALFAAIPKSQIQKARELGVSRPTVGDLEKAIRPPTPKLAANIRRKYKIPLEAWRRKLGPDSPEPYLGGVERQIPNAPTGPRAQLAIERLRERQEQAKARAAERARVGTTEGPTLIEAMRAQRDTLVDTELLPASQIELRAIDERIDEALERLTEFERVVCHAGFRGLRAALVGLFAENASEYPALFAGIAEALPEPPTTGAVTELRECRRELEGIRTSLQAVAARCMSGGSVSRAARFDAQSKRAGSLIRKAMASDVNMTALLKTETWRKSVRQVSSVVRGDLEVLQACKEVLAPINEPFAIEMLEQLSALSQITWPCERFQNDIEGFFYYILGCDPWSRQRELLLNVQEPNAWVAVASGHRVSKSYSLAGIALWFYSSFPNARVFITAPTERQLNEIDWREIQMRVAMSGICYDCRCENEQRVPRDRIVAPCPHSAKIEGYQKESAKGGMKSDDFRQIQGFTAKDAESAAGLAGENMMFLVEEASGVGASIFLALKGNLAGGGWLVLFGNPTQNEGEFFDAFHQKRKAKKNEDGESEEHAGNYTTMHISSLESPNVAAGRIVVKGLATREWCEARRLEWGEDSAQYKIRVLGQFALGEDGKLFPVAVIVAAEERWLDTLEEGPLYIGLDPAGSEGTGDDIGFAVRRGLKILRVWVKKGLSEDGQLAEVLQTIAEYRRPGERATVNIDCENMGAGVVSRFRQYADSNSGVMSVHAIRASSAPQREKQIYDRWRDELGGNFARWMRSGGAIPEDIKLSAELHAFEMKLGTLNAKGERSKLTPKVDIKKKLHRSPDRFDACALAVWDQLGETESIAEAQPEGAREQGGALDPYGGAEESGGAIDPYA